MIKRKEWRKGPYLLWTMGPNGTVYWMLGEWTTDMKEAQKFSSPNEAFQTAKANGLKRSRVCFDMSPKKKIFGRPMSEVT